MPSLNDYAARAFLPPQFWGAFVDPTIIEITSAAAAATIGRMHRLSDSGSGIYNITLPAHGPSAGQVIGFTVQNSGDLTAQWQLDAGVTVTLAGRSRYLRLTHLCTVVLYSDGSRWLPLVMDLTTPWIDSGPITIWAVTTNPTKGSVVIDRLMWRRVGSSAEYRMHYQQSTAGAAGSGEYLFSIPFDADLALNTLNAVGGTRQTVGTMFARGTTSGDGYVSLSSVNQLSGRASNTTDANQVGSTFYSLNNATISYSIMATVPTVRW